MVSESLGNTVHVWGRFYFQSAFLCTLKMMPSGPLSEGYNGALIAFATVGYASSTYRVRLRQLHLFLLLPAHRTNQELCQSASEFPLTVPLSTVTDTFLVTVLILALWRGLGTPYHSSSSDDQPRRAQVQGASLQGLLTDRLTGPCYW